MPSTDRMKLSSISVSASFTNDFIYFGNAADLSSNLLLVPRGGNKEAEAAAEKRNVPVASAAANSTGQVSVVPKHRCEMAHVEALTQADPDDIALFLHTSGTTGLPKGVPLSHRNMLTTMMNIRDSYNLTPEDRGYVVMPLFHVHGLMAALFAPLFSGGSIVIPSGSVGFQANLLWGHIVSHQCTWYTAVPTMHQSLLASPEHYEAAGKPLLRFIRSCSSSLPPPVLVKLEEVFQAPVLEAYAMTEACHQMTTNPLPEYGPHKAGSVGKPFNVELKIIGSQSEVLAQGLVGEVCVRGGNVTRGYHNRPDANSDAFLDDGFFRTGDLGYLDEEGYLYLTGRIKEQINRGGEKIAPVAIDNVLLDCPGIAGLFAFGAPHKELGEVVAVVVVLKKGANVSLKQINAFGLKSGKLTSQWLPLVIVYCDAIPKGPTGKVQRTKLASILGIPPLSAIDGPTSFTYSPSMGLQRIDTNADTLNSDLPETVTGLREWVGNVLGLDLTGLEQLTIDSFSAVTLSGAILSRYRVDLSPKDLVSLSLPRIVQIILRNCLQNHEFVARIAGNILGIELVETSSRIPLDSFSAVTLCGVLQSKYQVNLEPRDLLLSGQTLGDLYQLIQQAVSFDDSSAAVTPSDQVIHNPVTPEDFEGEALLPDSLQLALRNAAENLRDVPLTARGSVLLTGATGFIGKGQIDLIFSQIHSPHHAYLLLSRNLI
jgi:oxalate---CoA ligase